MGILGGKDVIQPECGTNKAGVFYCKLEDKQGGSATMARNPKTGRFELVHHKGSGALAQKLKDWIKNNYDTGGGSEY